MKQKIEVKEKATGKTIKVIRRKLVAESMGNFNPVFCQYDYKKHLVKSMGGDLSDPFRREESYLDSLYIEI